MRALWTEPVVDFAGRWHRVPEAGINPLPVQRPIPVWFGGQAEPVLRRVGRLGDGWFPQMLPDTTARKNDGSRIPGVAGGRSTPIATAPCSAQRPDVDPVEAQDWRESMDGVVDHAGPRRLPQPGEPSRHPRRCPRLGTRRQHHRPPSLIPEHPV